jgi:hypothetical protein
MITTTRDIFSIQGAIETEQEVHRIFEAYGKRGSFSRAEDDTTHASTRKNREAMYAFFQKYLRNPGDPRDVPVRILTPDEIRVTRTGQVATSVGGETVFSLNSKEAERIGLRLDSMRQHPDTGRIIEAARRISGYVEPDNDDKPVFAGRFVRNGYSVERFFVKGEGNYIIPYLLMKPPGKCIGGVLLLHPGGKSALASPGSTMEWFVRKGYAVLSPDMVGTGETGPGVFRGDAYIEGGSHNIFYGAILIGRSVVGIRTSDALKLTEILERECGTTCVSGVAFREMTPVLLHAAAFDMSLSRIALIEPCASYISLAKTHFYNASFIPGVVPGAVKEYDLPDLEGILAPRKLLLSGITDGAGSRSPSGEIDQCVAKVRRYYESADSPGNIIIRNDADIDNPGQLFDDWLKE